MRRSVPGMGGQGICYDIPPIYLPGNTWTGGRNVRFRDGSIVAVDGAVDLGVGAETAGVKWGDFMQGNPLKFYLFSNLDKVYSYDGTTVYDITRSSGGDYNGTEDSLFDLDNFNGVGILNNGIDAPQQWAATSGSATLAILSNWTSTWRARTITGFKNFLVATHITKTSTVYPYMVKWSHSAEPGAVPASWDHTDPTKDAGEISLPDTKNGEIINQRVLGDYLYIYKESSIWALSYVGGIKIFEPTLIPGNAGLKIRRSLATIPGASSRSAAHFFADEGNFYVMDGSGATPVFEQVFKREILRLIDPDYFSRSFSVVNMRRNELWYCIPEQGSEVCTLAFTWNFKDNTYAIRELSGTLSIASGLGFAAEDVAGVVDLPFSDETLFRDGVGFYDTAIPPTEWSLAEASSTDAKIYLTDRGIDGYAGEPVECYVERTLLGNVGKDGSGSEEVNYSIRKLISAVIPKFASQSLRIQVGISETDAPETIVWSDPITYEATTFRADLPFPLSGRFISVRFLSSPGAIFRINSFDYEIDLLGEF